MPSQQDVIDTTWDAIVIGTGMGGATLGYALAKAGHRVLFCEKGRSISQDSLRGDFAETFFDRPKAPSREHSHTLTRTGRYVDTIEDLSPQSRHHHIPFIGCGTGGSSALYGMALERFYPADFTPRQHFHNAEEADLPESWPIGYDELRPYYRQAESLYRVRGTTDPLRAEHLDPLRDPPPMTGASSELFEFLRDNGHNPYQLPMACERVPDCLGCQGFLCPKDCKNDAARICLLPAINDHGAQLLDECRAVRLEATAGAVTSVVCERHGETFTLRAKQFVIAAGALQTPCLLLRSKSKDWPNGLANGSGLVGRNLMRHLIDLYAVSLKNPDGLGSPMKELAFNDYYLNNDHGKLGTVQSFGMLPPAPVIAAGMEQDIRDGSLPWLAPAFKLIKPFLTGFLAKRLASSLMLASIIEDLPYADNHVRPGTNGDDVQLEYTLRRGDTQRIRSMRENLARAFKLKPYRFMLIKQAENNDRIAHACGTCRFGHDPRTSVLDASNKAHELENLYVADSSFFPSSAGTNPALTISANALRVADHILATSA